MQPDGGVGSTRTPGYKRDTGLGGQFGIGIGGKGETGLMAVGDQPEARRLAAQRLEHREIALTGHTESCVAAMGQQRGDQGVTAIHGRGRSQAISNTASTSTATLKGKLAALTAKRACRPLSSNTSTMRSEAPLMIFG